VGKIGIKEICFPTEKQEVIASYFLILFNHGYSKKITSEKLKELVLPIVFGNNSWFLLFQDFFYRQLINLKKTI